MHKLGMEPMAMSMLEELWAEQCTLEIQICSLMEGLLGTNKELELTTAETKLQLQVKLCKLDSVNKALRLAIPYV